MTDDARARSASFEAEVCPFTNLSRMDKDVQIDDAIRVLLRQHVPIHQIKSLLHVSQARITRARCTPLGTSTRVKTGRPPKVTNEIRAIVERETLADGALHDQELADRIKAMTGTVISHDTVRLIRHDAGFCFRARMTIQALTDRQKNQRLEFCQWMLGQENIDFSRIVFSDESRFCQGPDNTWVYVRRGDWNESVMVQREKFSAGVMCFAAIGLGFKSPLIFCRTSVNSQEYTRCISDSGVIPEMDRRYHPFQWLFMQDGAASHTCHETMCWLRDRVNILPGWPANSPDLNPIELLWAIVKRRRFLCPPASLQDQVLQAWEGIDQSTINALVMDFRRRCEMVVAVRGASISQFISSHKVPDVTDDVMDAPYPHFEQAIDDDLLVLVGERGNKWKVVAEEINSRHDTSFVSLDVRQRYKTLVERRYMTEAFAHRPDGRDP